jgi:hypothetical protein
MRTCIALLAFSVSAVVAADEQPLDLRVSPRNCLSPCTIRAIIFADPHASNRALVLELDSPAYFRSSVITLDGSNAPRIHEREFAALTAGSYEVRVSLRRASDDRFSLRRATVEITNRVIDASQQESSPETHRDDRRPNWLSARR